MSATAFAFSDPPGETYPRVIVKGGSFEVSCSFHPSSGAAPHNGIVREYSQTGRLLRERPGVPPSPIYLQRYSFPQLSEEQSGLEVPDGEDWLVIPEWEGKHGGKPYFIRIAGEKITYHHLPWPSADVSFVTDALVDGRALILLVTREAAGAVLGRPTLWLYRFDLGTLKEEASAELPTPISLFLPVCSNLVAHDGEFHVALVAPGIIGVELLLCSWDGRATRTRPRPLAKRVDGNTHISMANIGGRALVAYHDTGIFSLFNPDARIRTVAVSLNGRDSSDLQDPLTTTLVAAGLVGIVLLV